MIRLALIASTALLMNAPTQAVESPTGQWAIEVDDGYGGEFYQALLGAFYGEGSDWGPGDNPGSFETPDPGCGDDEECIEPGDLLPGPTDNGNCMDWQWEGSCA